MTFSHPVRRSAAGIPDGIALHRVCISLGGCACAASSSDLADCGWWLFGVFDQGFHPGSRQLTISSGYYFVFGVIIAMIRFFSLAVLLLAASAFGDQALAAGSAAERAADLKTWRAQCSDMDPDLQMGYLEAAIENGDQSILRVCLRQALNSDSEDTRNLALRAAVAATGRIIFETKIPPELEKAYEEAGKDKAKKAKIDGYYITHLYSLIRNGLSFAIKDAEMGSRRSTWASIVRNTEPADGYDGQATIIGSSINWTGLIDAGRQWRCDLHVELADGARLDGTFACDDLWAIPVSGPLL
ncbi:hypothetical protein FMN50_15140 [Rhodobacterales bacterium]|nr:hypothetical protein FMN50_15140 [Rhodobacterales bacterium]